MSERDKENNNFMLKLEVHDLINFSADNKTKFLQIVDAFNETINSNLFKERILNFKYEYSTYTGRLWWKKYSYHTCDNFNKNKGLTREYIYKMIMSGKDQFNTDEDHDIDLFLTLYYSSKNVIGYTYPDTYKTWVNSKYFLSNLNSRQGRANIIANIMHEYMHNLGFGHGFRNNPTRQYTVPYAIGYIAGDAALSFLK